ncbi:hypothetical protein NQZ68_002341 [Dissostichus eleginoides]|nr:hypothetical protein NQZ68_002341 [Dissostichus eleginoides]
MSRRDKDRDEPWTESLIVTLPREKREKGARLECEQEFSSCVFLEKEEGLLCSPNQTAR